MSKLPKTCPSCDGRLSVKRLTCDACETDVDGLYRLPEVACLLEEDQEFVMRFVMASGSLKEMAKLLGVSYPTVRNRLDDIIMKVKKIQRGKG